MKRYIFQNTGSDHTLRFIVCSRDSRYFYIMYTKLHFSVVSYCFFPPLFYGFCETAARSELNSIIRKTCFCGTFDGAPLFRKIDQTTTSVEVAVFIFMAGNRKKRHEIFFFFPVDRQWIGNISSFTFFLFFCPSVSTFHAVDLFWILVGIKSSRRVGWRARTVATSQN